MSWTFQFARFGNYRLEVNGFLGWKYEVWWHSDTARTCVGKGSEEYDDVYSAREAAVRHLANILSKPQREKLLMGQAELVWEPTFGDPRTNPMSRLPRLHRPKRS